jgi:hypothetical protein
VDYWWRNIAGAMVVEKYSWINIRGAILVEQHWLRNIRGATYWWSQSMLA